MLGLAVGVVTGVGVGDMIGAKGVGAEDGTVVIL